MTKYLLIESRDPYESNDVAHTYDLAQSLMRAGSEVTVFLVQNGVLPARAAARAEGLGELVASGVKVLADDFSLRERAIPQDRLRSGVSPAPLERVIDQLASGARTIWN